MCVFISFIRKTLNFKVDGTISAHLQSDGALVWSIKCASSSPLGTFFPDDELPCINDLQGVPSISSDGRYLYFGDTIGNIMKLNLDYLSRVL